MPRTIRRRPAVSHRKSSKRLGHRKRGPNPVARHLRERHRERDLHRLRHQSMIADGGEVQYTRKGAHIVQA